MSTALDGWCALVAGAVETDRGGPIRRRSTGDDLPEDNHVHILRSWIYHDVHAAGVLDDAETLLDDPEALEAITGLDLGCWSAPGWTVMGPEGPGWIVSRAGTRLVVTAHDLPSGAHPGAGTTSVLIPRLRPRVMPGWAAFASRTGPAACPDARAYAHLRGLDVLPSLLAALEELDVPWGAKVSTRRRGMERPDGFVVYVAAKDLSAVTTLLRSPRAAAWLSDPVPGFSHRLAPGLAASVDPPGWSGGSFGAHVSHRAALALLAGEDVRSALAPCYAPLPLMPPSTASSSRVGSVDGSPSGRAVEAAS